jgi:hypothetical protein
MGEPYSLAVAAGAGVMTSLVKAGTVPAKHFVGKNRQWDTFKDIEDNLSQMKEMIDRIQNGDDAAMINDLLSKWNSTVRQYRFTPDQERKLKAMEDHLHCKMVMWGIAFRDESDNCIPRGPVPSGDEATGQR